MLTSDQRRQIEERGELYTRLQKDPLNQMQAYLPYSWKKLKNSERKIAYKWWCNAVLQCQIGIEWTDDDLLDTWDKW